MPHSLCADHQPTDDVTSLCTSDEKGVGDPCLTADAVRLTVLLYPQNILMLGNNVKM